nr:hypothetical protein BaRGS_025501 [Batillaria attramentaria]
MARSCCNLRRHQLLREFLAEALGTFILMEEGIETEMVQWRKKDISCFQIFGIGSVAQAVLSGDTLGSHMSIHWSWGLGVALGVSASAGVTGGHINPAVSLTMAVMGRLPWLKVPVYMMGQYLGSFLAASFVFLIYWDALDNFDGGVRMVEGDKATAGIWSTYPQPYVSTWTCFGDQVFGTAVLLICVLALTDSGHGPKAGLTPFCVGGVVVVIGMTFGLNCGYAINPARDLAPRVFTAIAGWGAAPFT